MGSGIQQTDVSVRAAALIEAVGMTGRAEGEEALRSAVASLHANAVRLNELDLTGWEPVLVYRPAERVQNV